MSQRTDGIITVLGHNPTQRRTGIGVTSSSPAPPTQAVRRCAALGGGTGCSAVGRRKKKPDTQKHTDTHTNAVVSTLSRISDPVASLASARPLERPNAADHTSEPLLCKVLRAPNRWANKFSPSSHHVRVDSNSGGFRHLSSFSVLPWTTQKRHMPSPSLTFAPAPEQNGAPIRVPLENGVGALAAVRAQCKLLVISGDPPGDNCNHQDAPRKEQKLAFGMYWQS